MKSMNVKRIAAVATGAAMIAAAAVGAAVNFDTAGVGSFQFLSAGEPQVKVVIGSKAKPEDVVVGANIAAVLGNLAYTDKPVTVMGTDKLGVSGTGGDLSDKTVGLSITTPGVNPANAYEMKAYVEDDLDFSIDSNRSTTGGMRFATQATSFGPSLGPKVITKDQTAIIAPAAGMPSDGKIIYPVGTTNTKEDEKVYAFAYVRYDSNAKVVRAEQVKTGYEAVFSDPIPLCLETSKSFADCDESKLLKKNNVEITFLGDKWTIFDHTDIVNTTFGTVTLGKQISRKDSFQIDDQVTTPDGYVIVLKDISAFSPQRAQFDILDKDNKLIKRLYLGEGSSSTVSEANNIVVKVNKVFPGAFAKQGIADVSMFSSQLIVGNDAEISGGDSHKDWKGKVIGATVGSSDGISKIQVYNDQDQLYKVAPAPQKTMLAGESLDIIKGMPGYKLNFLGLETVDYDSLQFSIQKTATLSTADAAAPTITGNVLSIVSGKSNAFQFGSRSVPDVYVVLESTNATAASPGQILFINANGQYTTNGATNYTLSGTKYTNSVDYHYNSDEKATLYFESDQYNNPANNNTAVFIAIPELTETNNGTAASATGNFHLNLLYDASLDQFVNGMASTTIDKVGYDNGVAGTIGSRNLATNERGFTTWRGNMFTGVSSTSATISYATKIAQARFTLTKGTGTSSSGAGTSASVTLKEGDPYTIGGGYSLKVDSITAKVTGGGAGSVTGVDQLAASQKSAAVVTPLNTDSQPLVVLDSAASDTSRLIVVGGQIVNSVAQAAGVNLKQGDQPEVQVVGSTKLIVAGYTAADTSEAGNALIAWLNQNRNTVRG